jgi:UDP-N-acetylglucosamine 2-epimerase
MNIKFNFFSLLNNLENINYNNLYEFFSKNHKYNLFVKKYNENEHLLMIHNNQNILKEKDNEIYNECRSIIIDTYDQTKVVSYSHDNVLYSTIEEYVVQKQENDIIEESYEGSMVNVFNYNDKWYFSSTKCPTINNSYFFCV